MLQRISRKEYTVNLCKLLKTAELHFCQLFPGPSETQNKVLILLPSAGSRHTVEGSLSLWLLFPPCLEQRLEQIAPMLYQLHHCRNWLHSKRCHNCTNTGLPNPIIQPRQAPGNTHSTLLMKSMFSNQVVITGEPPASEDLPQHHSSTPKVRKQ